MGEQAREAAILFLLHLFLALSFSNSEAFQASLCTTWLYSTTESFFRGPDSLRAEHAALITDRAAVVFLGCNSSSKHLASPNQMHLRAQCSAEWCLQVL